MAWGGHATNLELERVHFWVLVGVVFAGVTEFLLEFARFLRKRPNQAFSSGQDVGLAVVDGVAISVVGVYRLPAFCHEHGDEVVEEEGIQRVVVEENGVARRAAKYAPGERVIVVGAVPDVLQEEIAIGRELGVGVFFNAQFEAGADGPVGGIDGVARPMR